jgi:hypothetical protein
MRTFESRKNNTVMQRAVIGATETLSQHSLSETPAVVRHSYSTLFMMLAMDFCMRVLAGSQLATSAQKMLPLRV